MISFKSPSIAFHIPFWVGIIFVSMFTGILGRGLWDFTMSEAMAQGEAVGEVKTIIEYVPSNHQLKALGDISV